MAKDNRPRRLVDVRLPRNCQAGGAWWQRAHLDDLALAVARLPPLGIPRPVARARYLSPGSVRPRRKRRSPCRSSSSRSSGSAPRPEWQPPEHQGSVRQASCPKDGQRPCSGRCGRLWTQGAEDRQGSGYASVDGMPVAPNGGLSGEKRAVCNPSGAQSTVRLFTFIALSSLYMLYPNRFRDNPSDRELSKIARFQGQTCVDWDVSPVPCLSGTSRNCATRLFQSFALRCS